MRVILYEKQNIVLRSHSHDVTHTDTVEKHYGVVLEPKQQNNNNLKVTKILMQDEISVIVGNTSSERSCPTCEMWHLLSDMSNKEQFKRCPEKSP